MSGNLGNPDGSDADDTHPEVIDVERPDPGDLFDPDFWREMRAIYTAPNPEAHEPVPMFDDLPEAPVQHDYSVWIASKRAPLHVRRKVRQRRYARISTLLAMGWTETAIAAELGTTLWQISEDCRAMRQYWVETMLTNVEEEAAKDLKRLEAAMTRAFELAMSPDDRVAVAALASIVKIVDSRSAILGYKRGAEMDVTEFVRQIAEANGHDPDAALAVAARIAPLLK